MRYRPSGALGVLPAILEAVHAHRKRALTDRDRGSSKASNAAETQLATSATPGAEPGRTSPSSRECSGTDDTASGSHRCPPRRITNVDFPSLGSVYLRRVKEQRLGRAIPEVINSCRPFVLARRCGTGKRAPTGMTKSDLYDQNLLARYHIRYGGYAQNGHHHVSGTDIALLSRFIPCGVWQAVYILDGLLKNQSGVDPDSIHADTQGMSASVFGLASLLGISLMSRIRNWKDLKLYRPSKTTTFQHIDGLSSDPINCDLIRTHLPDMLRVVLSIKAGRIAASTIHRKLGTYTRKNRLYHASVSWGAWCVPSSCSTT